MKRFLTHITHLSFPVAVLLSLCCIGFWVPTCLAADAPWHLLVPTFVLMVANALVLTWVIYQRSITTQPVPLPLFLYVLLISTTPALHTLWQAQVACLFFQIVLLVLIHSYRHKMAVENAFLATILLCCAAFVMPDMLFLLPVLWLMFAVNRALNLRVFLASLIGGIFVLIYTAIAQYLHWFQILSMADSFVRASDVHFPLVSTCLLIGGALLFIILAMMGNNQENNHISSFLVSIVLALVLSLVLSFFPPAFFVSLLIIALYSIAVLASYVFLTRPSVFFGILFLVMIIGTVLHFTLPLFLA